MQAQKQKKFPIITYAEDIFLGTDFGSSPEQVLMILMDSQNERLILLIFSLIFKNVERQE